MRSRELPHGQKRHRTSLSIGRRRSGSKGSSTQGERIDQNQPQTPACIATGRDMEGLAEGIEGQMSSEADRRDLQERLRPDGMGQALANNHDAGIQLRNWSVRAS